MAASLCPWQAARGNDGFSRMVLGAMLPKSPLRRSQPGRHVAGSPRKSYARCWSAWASPTPGSTLSATPTPPNCCARASRSAPCKRGLGTRTHRLPFACMLIRSPLMTLLLPAKCRRFCTEVFHAQIGRCGVRSVHNCAFLFWAHCSCDCSGPKPAVSKRSSPHSVVLSGLK